MTKFKIIDVMQVMFQSGMSFGGCQFDSGQILRVAQRDDGSIYASLTDDRSDCADTTLAAVPIQGRSYISICHDVMAALGIV